MRIAQVAPLYESVPPKLYGGTERVVSNLTEELVRRGHEVTLYATADSETGARLVPCARTGLRLDPAVVDSLAPHLVMLERVVADSPRFDVIHYHTDYIHFPSCRRHGAPCVTTLHGRLDIPELVPLYDEYKEIRVVSISRSQRRPLPHANWVATIYHGLPIECASCSEGPGDYLVFLGRLSPEKRPDRAIEIAAKAGLPLKIMAKVDPHDRAYYEAKILPLLNDSNVDFVGEGSEAEKFEILAGAVALLFPIDWPEPFGLVQIEAMAVGTPVIAFPHGSVPEIVDDGVTGLVVRSVEEAVAAVPRARSLDRRRIRQVFEERFSLQRMADDYERLYRRVSAAPEISVRTRTAPRERPLAACAEAGDKGLAG